MYTQIVFGMEIMGIGFTAVVLSLFVLYLILLLFGKLFSEQELKLKPPKNDSTLVPHLAKEEDTELVAVINAAVTAYLMGTSSPEATGEMFLPVFKEDNKSKWSANARIYLLQAGRELNILRRRK